METVITEDCFQISNVIRAHLWPHMLMSDTLFLLQNDGKSLWKDDSLNKRKIKLKSRTSHSLASLDFKDEVKLFQSFQIAKLFSLQFLLILYHFICEVYINHSWRVTFWDVAVPGSREFWDQFFSPSILP